MKWKEISPDFIEWKTHNPKLIKGCPSHRLLGFQMDHYLIVIYNDFDNRTIEARGVNINEAQRAVKILIERDSQGRIRKNV